MDARCEASYCVEHAGESEPWPGGEWQRCPNPGQTWRVLRVTEDVILAFSLCAAHDELWVGARTGTAPFNVLS